MGLWCGCMVKESKRGYYMRGIVLMGCVMRLRGWCEEVVIEGSGNMEGGEREMKWKGIMGRWLIIGVVCVLGVKGVL